MKKADAKGGNGDIYYLGDGKTVKKVLRNTSTEDRRPRFIKEIDVLRKLEGEGFSNIVKVIDYDIINDNNPWYTMKRYRGDSNIIIDLTRGNACKAAKLLLPVAETLMRLSERDPPIFHRDLKPENLLVGGSDDDPRLLIADFGCAYFASEDDRLTPEFRAVGAANYRAPEYHHGRVEEVTEKGDIFSLGKILWFFINGIKDDIFPYTLWFPDLYNLSARFQGVAGIAKANLLIAAATHHDAAHRLLYIDFIAQLRSLAEMDIAEENDDDLNVRALMFDEQMRLNTERREKIVTDLLLLFMSDLSRAIGSLPQFSETTRMREVRGFEINNIVKGVVRQSSNQPVWNYEGQSLKIETIIRPYEEWYAVGPLIQPRTEEPFIVFKICAYNQKRHKNNYDIIYIIDKENGVSQIVDNTQIFHDEKNLYSIFEKAVRFVTALPIRIDYE